jgi:hypothetical protein
MLMVVVVAPVPCAPSPPLCDGQIFSLSLLFFPLFNSAAILPLNFSTRGSHLIILSRMFVIVLVGIALTPVAAIAFILSRANQDRRHGNLKISFFTNLENMRYQKKIFLLQFTFRKKLGVLHFSY